VGQVLVNAAGNVPTWGALDLADTDGVTGQLPFGNLASLSALSVLGRFTNTSGVMAAITGAADQVLAVNSGGTVLAFGQVQTGGYANASVTLPKLANATASSVLGRSPASGGAYADITSSADGQVLRRGAAGVVAFGAVDLADADAVTGQLPLANHPDLAALSVLGRSAVTSGPMAAIAGSGNQVLRVSSGGSLGFGNIFGSVVNANSLPIDRLSDASFLSVLGRSASFAGPYADIQAGVDGQVLRRSGLSLAFGALDLADADGVTGQLPFGNLASLAAVSVLGNSTGATAAVAAITATSNGQVLRRASGLLGFGALDLDVAGSVAGQLPLANLLGGTAVGQVLRNAAGNIPAWGALDLADADAIAGRLPLGNLANGTTGRVLVAGASDPAFGFALGNNTDAFTYNAASHDWYVGGSRKLLATSSALTLYQSVLNFDSSIASTCIINVATTSVAGAAGRTLGVWGQNSHGTGATIGGAMDFRAGESLSGTGGAFTIASGTGATTAQDGAFALKVGVSSVFTATPTVTALAVTGGTLLQLSDLSGVRVLGLCGSFSAFNMPANTGDGVAFWKHASDRPTIGKSIGGAVVWNDETFGLSYKSDFGVESTIAMTAAVLTAKRRIVDWKSPLEEVTTTSTGLHAVTSFDATTINGVAFTNGILTVCAKCHAFGMASYPAYCEWVATIRVTAGVASVIDQRPGFDSTIVPGVMGTGIINPTITASGGVVVFRAQPFFSSLKFAAYFEVYGTED
jgi:hypothetical protein